MTNTSKRTIWISIIILCLIILAGILVWFLRPGRSVDTSEYQAVFLSNGQAYFGKLSISNKWLTLTNVYYLQTQTQSAAGTSTTPPATTTPAEIKLVKLGSELHGPEDAMYLDPQNVLFWENLKPDSKVVQAIEGQK